MTPQLTERQCLFVIAAIIAISAILLLMLGRVPWCTCGSVKLWHGDIFSSENSQHISDWYSPSHVVHGTLSYALLTALFGSQSLGQRALLAVLIEETWEILENTNYMIERYRETTISLGYFGDSVVNSVGDVSFMLGGFFLAARMPIWASVVVVVTLELAAGFFIRDNLTLNIIMLIYPVEFIKAWQMGSLS